MKSVGKNKAEKAAVSGASSETLNGDVVGVSKAFGALNKDTAKNGVNDKTALNEGIAGVWSGVNLNGKLENASSNGVAGILGDFGGGNLSENFGEKSGKFSENGGEILGEKGGNFGKNDGDFGGKIPSENPLKITLNSDELALFELIKCGLFGVCTHLMDENEIKEIVESGAYKGKIMPYTLSFAPQDFDENALKNFVNLKANLSENSQINSQKFTAKNSLNLNENSPKTAPKNSLNSNEISAPNSQNFPPQAHQNAQKTTKNSQNLATNSQELSQKIHALTPQISAQNPIFDLVFNNQKIGHFTLKSHFKNKGDMKSIFTPTTCPLNQTFVSGEFELYGSKIAAQKAEFEQKKAHINAQKITAVISSFEPLHRAYEKILRWTIDKADMVVIFLTQSSGLSFALRRACLQRFIELYLPKDRFFIFDLEGASIFASHFGVPLEPIIAKNLGCTKLVVGQNHTGLGMFYEDNRPRTMLDEIVRSYDIELVVLPEFVYCTACKISVSTRSCPHGAHHHIKFHPASLKELLRLGILPPPVFIRREVSALILSELFPGRFEHCWHIYDDLFPSAGLVKAHHNDEDFYEKLLSLYQLSYMI